MNIENEKWTLCEVTYGNICQCFQIGDDHGPVCKVTNGKWGDDYAAIRLVGDSSLDQKAEAYMEQLTYGEISLELAQRRAVLIAASPELLNALKASLLRLTELLGKGYSDDDMLLLGQIESAIQKATKIL